MPSMVLLGSKNKAFVNNCKMLPIQGAIKIQSSTPNEWHMPAQ